MTYAGILLQYLWHRLRARRWDAFHSPYLYQLFVACCQFDQKQEKFARIEEERKVFRASREVIERQDLGAGSLHSANGNRQKISDIARDALSLPFQCRFLARLADFSKSGCVVEFGTSLGITASYVATLAPKATMLTVEGDPEIAARAEKLFRTLNLTNITLERSSFEDWIQTKLREIPTIDLIFLDGDHRRESLLAHYAALLSKCHEGTIMMIDDIHWNRDMYSGWNELIRRPEVTQSVDCYHFGLLFFRSDFMGKEHHKVRLPLRSLWS